MEKTGCLIRCHGEHCSSSQCCSKEKFMEDSCSDTSVKHRHSINKRLDKKEIIPTSSEVDLRRFTVHDEESSRSHQLKTDLDREACGPDDEQNNKDNTVDSSSYAINVDVNNEKGATSQSVTNQEIACER